MIPDIGIVITTRSLVIISMSPDALNTLTYQFSWVKKLQRTPSSMTNYNIQKSKSFPSPFYTEISLDIQCEQNNHTDL